MTKPKKRIILLVFVIAGAVLTTNPYLQKIRSKFTSFFLISEKISKVSFDSEEVIQTLEHQVAKLSWDIINLKEELQNLKQLRETHSIRDIPIVIPAQIVFKKSTSSFKRTFWINRGKLDGVVCGSVILSGNVLVGKVVEVTEKYSQCVHISDPTIRIKIYVVANLAEIQDDHITQTQEKPVEIPQEKKYTLYSEGICTGKNGFCELKHIEKSTEKWKEGKLGIITSNDSSDFPPNLVVGTIESPYQKDKSKSQKYDAGVFWDLKIDILDLQKLRTVLVVLSE